MRAVFRNFLSSQYFLTMSCHAKPKISLLQVREVFSESLFFYRPDSVSIMDGTDEGTLSITPLPYLIMSDS